MHIHHHPKRRHYTKWVFWFVVIGLFGVAIYLVHHGNIDSWQEADCAVIGNRVIRDYVGAAHASVLVLYKAQYQLRYTVGGRDFYIWADAGVSDTDKRFVEGKVDYLPEHCNYRVRYNPIHPDEAIAIWKRVDR
jgi:hypothetical protein